MSDVPPVEPAAPADAPAEPAPVVVDPAPVEPPKPAEPAVQPTEADVAPLVQAVKPGEEPLYRLRYVGGLEAVEEAFKTLRHGDEVDVPANRAADLCDHDPPDWEPVGDHPVRVHIIEEG